MTCNLARVRSRAGRTSAAPNQAASSRSKRSLAMPAQRPGEPSRVRPSPNVFLSAPGPAGPSQELIPANHRLASSNPRESRARPMAASGRSGSPSPLPTVIVVESACGLTLAAPPATPLARGRSHRRPRRYGARSHRRRSPASRRPTGRELTTQTLTAVLLACASLGVATIAVVQRDAARAQRERAREDTSAATQLVIRLRQQNRALAGRLERTDTGARAVDDRRAGSVAGPNTAHAHRNRR
jgi:hypothetical protein